MTPVPYVGRVDCPLPPRHGFRVCDEADAAATAHLEQLGQLGQLPPLWHYVDRHTPEGTFRFFQYETPAGRAALSALRYVGATGTMGDVGPIAAPNIDTRYMTARRMRAGARGGSGYAARFRAGRLGALYSETQSQPIGSAVLPPPTITTAEPIPKPIGFGRWVPDDTRPLPKLIAAEILSKGQPVHWRDGTIYETFLPGPPARWAFSMWTINSRAVVATWRWVPSHRLPTQRSMAAIYAAPEHYRGSFARKLSGTTSGTTGLFAGQRTAGMSVQRSVRSPMHPPNPCRPGEACAVSPSTAQSRAYIGPAERPGAYTIRQNGDYTWRQNGNRAQNGSYTIRAGTVEGLGLFAGQRRHGFPPNGLQGLGLLANQGGDSTQQDTTGIANSPTGDAGPSGAATQNNLSASDQVPPDAPAASDSGTAADQPPTPKTDAGGGGGGQTSPFPLPAPDANGTWVADASNPKVVAIANSISYHNTPAPWVDQGSYDTTVDGSRYRLVMWWQDGHKNVAAYRYVPKAGASPAIAKAGMGAGPWIAGGVVTTALALAIGLAGKTG